MTNSAIANPSNAAMTLQTTYRLSSTNTDTENVPTRTTICAISKYVTKLGSLRIKCVFILFMVTSLREIPRVISVLPHNRNPEQHEEHSDG